MSQNGELAQELIKTASQDDIEIKPALRQLMSAVAQLLTGAEAQVLERLKQQDQIDALAKTVDDQKTKLDSTFKYVLGFSAGFSLAFSLLFGMIVFLVQKMIAP